MALELPASVNNTGIICENAYLKIGGDVKISGNNLSFNFRIYSCQETREAGKDEIGGGTIHITYNGNIPSNETERIALFYTEIKKLPEYADAIDVLEE